MRHNAKDDEEVLEVEVRGSRVEKQKWSLRSKNGFC